MAKKATTLHDNLGNDLLPVTNASITFMDDGNSVQAEINDLKEKTQYNKGHYTTERELLTAYPNNISNPSSRRGWYAIVGSTDTVWIWDIEGNEWSNSGVVSSGGVESVNGLDGEVILTGGNINATATINDTSTTKSINGHLNDIYSDLNNYLPLTAGSGKKLTGALNFSADAKFQSDARIFRFGDSSDENSVAVLAGAGSTYFFRPSLDNKSTLGTSVVRWKNLYLSGDLSDGTNSISVADIANKEDIPDTSRFVPNTRTVNGKALSSNISLGSKDVGALPDYTITINHQSVGNPRMVKFASVNYTSRATCFKMGAMTCHDNGVSYRFLIDMLISVTTAGDVTANIYKFAQSSIGNVDDVERYTGDVFYVNDTTNKIVDFYILCGQWSSSQFTPVTKVGNTTIDYVTQYSGSATYYSSGTKEWVSGCGATYARTSDIPTLVTLTQAEYDALTTKDANTYYFIKEE